MDRKCCSWPCNNDGVSALHHEIDKQKTPRASGSKRSSSSRSGKESRGLAGLLSRKFFRYKGRFFLDHEACLNQVPCLIAQILGYPAIEILTSTIVCFTYHIWTYWMHLMDGCGSGKMFQKRE